MSSAPEHLTQESPQWVVSFNDPDHLEALLSPGRTDKDLLGGKGAGLSKMTQLGLPVPPGFTITTEACNAYLQTGDDFPEGMWEQTLEALAELEKQMGRRFGDADNPLLVSCRSGARESMPGMMDTVLNLGLNDEAAASLARQTNDPRFAYDAYRRLVQMFGSVVMGVPSDVFETSLQSYKATKGVKLDTELDAADWQIVTNEFKYLVHQHTDQEFPQDPQVQLRQATEAVFKSWNGKRAVDYREATGISHDLGTAVNIQTMVFGNMGEDSATGVAFTRNPSTGTPDLFGEYLPNAQGEDVVSGARTPFPISRLAETHPQLYQQLLEIRVTLEDHYQDMQDIEFTIERGKLWMLQTRRGERTAASAFRIAVDMVLEGLISEQEAIMHIKPEQLDQILHPHFDPEALENATFLAAGLNASPGAAVGLAVFDADTAETWANEGKSVILVRPETNPGDVHGMLKAKGILTQHGGATSHAAVVARGLGLPCVSGCETLRLDLKAQQLEANGVTIKQGDTLSIDGTTGNVYLGEVPTVATLLQDQPEVTTLLEWADKFRRLGVWANADYPRDAQKAHDFGAEGIGLCRTEHMFFEENRLPIVQRMILAETDAERQQALDELLPIQRADFEGLFRAMDGLPVVIRLIDPPLHEFLPNYDDLLTEVVTLRISGDDPNQLAQSERMLTSLQAMREANPMLGLRGVRLGIVWPAINQMQVRAIFEAACNVAAEGGAVHPEIMIPLVSHVNELKQLQGLLEQTAQQVMAETGISVDYKFGTMIEIPRAALTAGEMAQDAQFFSFGTNDLTQTTFGISRDDAEGKFLLKYVQDGILPTNPFQSLDEAGVGRLIEIAVAEGRATRPDLKIGICGEHGGDPASIHFVHKVGLNYVSCSPFRVPVARLAAAQAALSQNLQEEAASL